MRYAIYSEKMEMALRKSRGIIPPLVVWRRKNGTEVECTAVGTTPDCGDEWDDAIQLGEVASFVRVSHR